MLLLHCLPDSCHAEVSNMAQKKKRDYVHGLKLLGGDLTLSSCCSLGHNPDIWKPVCLYSASLYSKLISSVNNYFAVVFYSSKMSSTFWPASLIDLQKVSCFYLR